jgi:hypothetical protein
MPERFHWHGRCDASTMAKPIGRKPNVPALGDDVGAPQFAGDTTA